jgi:hypothetical protein
VARVLVAGILALAVAAACSGAAPAASVTPTSAPPTTPPSATAAPSASAEASGIVGSWHRAQTCQEMLAAFENAGLAESQRQWLQGNFFGGSAGPTTGDLCAGAAGPLEHSHFFTAGGGFGSRDEKNAQVDSGDYVVVDENTLSFPSHAQELGYSGDVLVDYKITEPTVTFDVVLPDECTGGCAVAHAWALSAFASGPWERGEVP